MIIARRASAAAVAILLCGTAARASVYELASEWMTVSFADGGKDRVLFTHLPDSDVFLHMKEYVTDSSSGSPVVELTVPLQELVLADPASAAQAPAKPLLLASRSTPYTMLVRFEPEHRRYLIRRPPDFSVYDSPTSATLPSVFGVKTDRPNNLLVLVRPEESTAPAAGLSDIESAAVNSLDSSERSALAGECGGEPGAPASLDCWHGKILGLLSRGAAPSSGGGSAAFEERYLQNRLSRKGYEQLLSLRSSAGGGKLSLADDWHATIIAQDLAADVAASAKPARASGKPAAPKVTVAPAKTGKPAPVKAVEAAVRPAEPASPPSEPKPAPRRTGTVAVLAVCAVAAVVILLAVR